MEEYKRHFAYYIVLALSNQYIENAYNIKINYILISIHNTLNKLYKYQELLPQSPVYTAAIAINLTFY